MKIRPFFLVLLFSVVAIFIGCSSSKTLSREQSFKSLTPKIEKAESTTVFEKKPYWELIQESTILGTPPPFAPIIFFDRNIGLVSEGRLIKKTTDGGYSWTNVFVKEGIGINSIVVKEDVLWFVGSESLDKESLDNFDKHQGTIWKSNDKGTSWKELVLEERSRNLLNSSFKIFTGICVDSNNNLWIVGDGGIAKLNNSADKLNLVEVIHNSDLLSINCDNTDTVWVIGKNVVFHHRDRWEKFEFDEQYYFYNVRSWNDYVWLIGHKKTSGKRLGVLLQSQTNGKSWEDKTPKNAVTLNDIYHHDKYCWLVGDRGSIFITRDDGKTWIKTISPTDNNLLSVFSLDANNIWISGDGKTILKNLN